MAGLLILSPLGSDLSFVHPLARAAIYHDLPPGRRSDLHHRAAALVDGELAVIRHRVAASLGQDAALAREAAQLGERLATRGEWAAAAEAFAGAQQVAIDPDERDNCTLRRTEALLYAGGVAEVGETLDAARLCAPGPLKDLVLGEYALFSGESAEAAMLLGRAWDACRHPQDDAIAARIADYLGHFAVNRGRGEDTVRWARQALTLAPAKVVPDAITLLCLGLGELGRTQQGLAELDRAFPLADETGRPDPDAMVGRGILQLWIDDLDGAQRTLGQAEAVMTRGGPVQLRLIALFYLADAEYRAGRWSEAVLHSQLAVSLAFDSDQTWIFALTHAVAVFPLASRGQWSEAEGHAVASEEAAANLGDGASTIWSSMARARLHRARGDWGGVRASLRAIEELEDFDGPDEPGIQPWRSLLVAAYIGLGQLDEAELALQFVERMASLRSHPTETLRAARLRGSLLAAQDRAAEADRTFDSAYTVDPSNRSPLTLALLETDHGRLLRRLGKRRASAEQLASACDRLATLGAKPFLEAAQREAAACGLRPRARTADLRLQLTPQETAVATLVVTGMTNRQVASELVVSEKTVEYHLGNVFTKLGITSRSALNGRLNGRT